MLPEEIRKSSRTAKPSAKSRENAESQFWESMKCISKAKTKLEIETKKNHPVSIQMNLKANIDETIEELRNRYEELRSMLADDVPHEIRQYVDKTNEELKKLSTQVETEENCGRSTGSRSKRSQVTSSSKRSRLTAMRRELEAKRLSDEENRARAELKKKSIELEMEFEEKKRTLETKQLEEEIEEAEEDYDSESFSERSSKRSQKTFKSKISRVKSQAQKVEQRTELPRITTQEKRVPWLSQSILEEPVDRPSTAITLDRPSTATTSQPAIEEIARTIAESMALSRLPPPEPFEFDGNPLKFTAWKSAFSTLIDNRGIRPKEKIHYLRKYLSSEPRETIESLFYFDDSYDQAMEILEKRYGNPFFVAEGFRTKIEQWPKISTQDNKGLLKFADFLQQCLFAMAQIPSLSILNDCRENKRMLEKLPSWITRKWMKTVTEHTEVGSYPSFATFVSFLAKEAKIVNNPVYSCPVFSNSSTQNVRPPKQRTINAVTAKPEAKENCTYCGKGYHSIGDCRGFARLTPEGRREFLMKRGGCFSCLKIGHTSKECPSKLSCQKCSRKHPTALCGDYEKLYPKTEEEETEHKGRSMCMIQGSTSSMIVPVYVSHEQEPKKEILAYALLDTQSDTTFILDETLKQLAAPSTETTLKLSTMTNTSRIKSQRAKNLMIRGMKSEERIKLPTVFTREFIPSNIEHIPTRKATSKWPHLRSIASEIPERQDCEVSLLIGYDCPQALAPTEVKRGEGNQPFAVKTELGWSVVGRIGCEEDESHVSHTTKVVADDPLIDARAEIHFTNQTRVKEEMAPSTIVEILESDFQERKCGKAMSQEDLRFMKIIEDGIHKDEEGFYEMPLPFKNNRPSLPSSKFMAEKRLAQLKRRLDKDPKYAEDYTAFVKEILKNGDAEVVPPHEVEDPRSWYIPHHGVYHPKKPNKLRVVFDCSAQSHGTALNDHLLQGPELMNSLIGVLCRFRIGSVAVIGDIQRMFHQFRVNPKDRNYLRFLWWPDGNTTLKPNIYRMKVHLFGATSSPGCANFGLRRLATDNADKYQTEAAKFIEDSFYVDDALGSFVNEEEAIRLISDVRDMCLKGNLRLHKFASNSKAVMQSIPESEHAGDPKANPLDDSTISRVLGIEWHIQDDQFRFRLTIPSKPMTRRGVLSAIASIYDPLGFLAPFVLIGKLLLQQMCKQNVRWDDELDEELKPKWTRWTSEILLLTKFHANRCIIPAEFGEIVKQEYHHFSDASNIGYGQCTYLRVVDDKGNVSCSLVMGKARVAPTKVQTIPRLELTAAVVSSRISSFLQQEMKHDQPEFFWTDSKIVLGYLNNDARRFHVFVSNRVQQIREVSKPEQWYHVRSEENPADYASRGMYAHDLMNSNWLTGPSFLWNLELPTEQHVPEIPQDDPEVKKTVVHKIEVRQTEMLIKKLERFSDFDSAVRAIAVIRKKIYGKTNRNTNNIKGETETKIIKLVQEHEFSEEIQILQQNKSLSKNNRLASLNPFIDEEGILRVGGRMKKASYLYHVKHPIILPGFGHIVNLIIQKYHQKTSHQGRGMTMNEIRSRGYWIIGASKAVSSHIFKCVTCRRLRGKNLQQRMSDLPVERLEASAPFTHCGLDCFGPFIVQEGRRELKRYGLIITCMASRAVHIELLDDMTTDSFINGLRCFIAIRGPVSTIRSDQGSNFIGASRELKEAVEKMKDEKMTKYFEENQMKFSTNTPHASHMGGVWERHIRTVRSILSAMMHQHSKRLDTTTLRTFLYEAMAIINSRPLSPQNLSDPQLEPLTPNHLIMMKGRIVLQPPGEFVKEDVYARRRWRKVQFLAQEFWNRWRKEYLTSLQARQKWTNTKPNITENDIVLLKDEPGPRGEWKMARVIETIKGDDGLVRRAKLQIGDPNLSKLGKRLTKTSHLERPVHKLVMLL